jgi:pyruvate,water dikinase
MYDGRWIGTLAMQHLETAGIRLIWALEDVGSADLALVGGKAANLGLLVRAGLAVPRGFVLGTHAYRIGRKSQGWAQVEADVVAAWEQLGAERACAVRSSATAEDLPHASFAGQQDTFLNVRGREALLEAVRGCWASLMSERAVVYRQRNAIGDDTVAMAVIVQEMVDARCAGVMFTADPLSGDRSRLVIEAVRGLGDALVSGRASPQRVVARREDGAVLERAGDGDAGLNDALVRQLAEAAERVEQVLGPDQDIEWAADAKQVWLLQARPITTIRREGKAAAAPMRDPTSRLGAGLTPPAAPRWVWTNANTGELVPDVATPLTWSFMQRFLGRLLEVLLGDIGKTLTANELIGLVAGRVYFNLTTLTAFLRALPGMSRVDVTEMIGGAQERMALDRAGESQALPVRLSRMQAWSALARVGWSVLLGTRRKLNLLLRDQGRIVRRNLALDLRTLSDRELIRRLVPARDITADHLEGAMFVITGLGAFDWLRRVCRSWLGDESGELANRLMVGVGDMDSAESALELWRLADLARCHPAVETAVMAGDGEVDRDGLPAVDGGQAFLRKWDAFMMEHGHHARGEVDPAVPRWSERPAYVMGLLRGYIRAAADSDPVARQQRLAQERLQLAAECRDRLGDPLRRFAFSWLLRRAQLGVAGRENLKSELVRIIAVMRKALIEFGRRLAERGLLDAGGDVFFLTLEEVEALSRGKPPGDLRARIAPRKAEYQRNLTLNPPPVVVGRFDPAAQGQPERADDVRVLRGLGVSAGVAEGPARVILHLDSEQRIRPGEVLVAPFTDPGWTPYFLTASAIVMDLGGMLSHGAIVAREYGVPAVVNVGPATKLIRTGQRLRVDGGSGIVTLIE